MPKESSTSSKSKKESTSATTKETKKSTTSTKDITPEQREKDEQLVDISEFDFDKLVISNVAKKENKFLGGFYRQSKLNYIYPNGKIGPLLVQFGKRFCFGVQPNNIDREGKIKKDKAGAPLSVTGYQVCLPMLSKDAPTDEERQVVEFLDNLKNYIQQWCVQNKKAVGMGKDPDGLVESKVGDILYRKKTEDGEYEDGYTPRLYIDLIYYSSNNSCETKFYGPNDSEIDPRSLVGKKFFNVIPTVRFDTIDVRAKIAIKYKLYDGTVELQESGTKKRFAPKNNTTQTEGGGDDGEEQEVTEQTADLAESESE